MHGNYYEAILQVRPSKRRVERFVESMLEKNSKARLSRKKRLKEGVDYYVSPYRFAIAMGNVLVKKFGGSIEVSKKLFGMRQGETLFRRTVAYRAPSIEVGEAVVSGNAPYLITSVGKDAIGKNLITGKKGKIVLRNGVERLEKFRAVVSKSEPLEVINSGDYQSVAVENLRESKAKKLTVVNYGGRVYLAE